MSEDGRVRLEHAEITGARVHLRPTSVEDAAASFELVHNEPLITDWILWDGPERVEELEERYSSWVKDGEDKTRYALSILERASGEWAGSIGIWHSHAEPVVVLGYLVGVPYQGRGIASEAVRYAVELAFREFNVLLVRAEVFVGNVASIRVLEKAGMRLDEGQEILQEKRGVQVSSHSFSLSRAAWELIATPEARWTVRVTREG